MRSLEELKRAAFEAPDRSAELFEQALALLPELPLKVQIQTTTRCNAACLMCPYPVVTGDAGFEHDVMSAQRYRRILADLTRGPVERVSLFLMNEPLLDKRLPEWIALARAALPNATLGLFTNGAALDPVRARMLATAGLDELCVSVHGFDAATYERVMAGLSFERLKRNLDQLLETAGRGELEGMKVLIVTGDVPEITQFQNDIPLKYRHHLVRKALSNERAAVGAAAAFPSSKCAATNAMAMCQRLFVKLYVLSNGDCVLCNVDWKRSVILGRVGDENGPAVADVWRGNEYAAVRREHFTDSFARASICRRCDYARLVDRE